MKTNINLKTKYVLFSLLLLLGVGHVRAQVITSVAGTGNNSVLTDTNTIATLAAVQPQGVLVDAVGNIYVSDIGTNRIRKISTSGIITTIAGTGVGGYSGDGGAATAAKLNFPTNLVMDGSGSLYFCDYNNFRIRKISASGIITTVVGTGVAGYSGDGGPATAAQLGSAFQMAMNATGTLYFYDAGTYRVRKVSTSGIITTIAGTGAAGYAGDGGPATAAKFGTTVCGVAIDPSGNVCLADYSNHRIRKINTTTGIITTIVGTGLLGSSVDGTPATATNLNLPASLVYDAAGNLYIGQIGDNTIRKVNTSGITSRYAGNGASGFNGNGIEATNANISVGYPLAVDANRNVYIGTNDARVRKITCAPYAGPANPNTTACIGVPISLGSSVSGGTWSSSTPAIATISASGSVYGVAVGVTTITYTVTNNCTSSFVTSVVSVNTTPAVAAIGGTATICAGGIASLTDATSGGTWSSAAPAIASVNTSGVVSGIAAGTANISYTITGTCGPRSATKTVTVNAAPSVAAISGASAVCVAATLSLTDTTAGGTWSSSATTIASVSATGLVRGNSAGTAVISYAVPSSCGTTYVTKSVTVNSVPTVAAISGTPYACPGTNTYLSNATSGGIWSSSAPSVAIVSTAGVVTGVTGGATVISYTVSSSCGNAYAVMTVNIYVMPVIPPISGPSTVCAGSTISLTNTFAGGNWYSSSNPIATVASTGVVSGVSAGTVGITYAVSSLCGALWSAKSITVNSTPVAAIGGTATVCTGSVTTLTDATAGGTWSSSAATIASVSATGVVSGNAVGTANISYAVTGICGSATATKTVTVNAGSAIAAIGGTATVCMGAITTLTDATAGGTWSSAAPTVASVSPLGAVSGISPGTVNISYTVTSTCGSGTVTKIVTVNTVPSVAAISGAATVATGATIALADATVGGIWSSTAPTIASVNSTGVVTGIAAGSATISYSVTNSCGTAAATKAITVSSAATSTTYVINTTIGTGTSGYNGEGNATTSNLSYPYAVATDAAGNVYIADQINNRIRKVNTSGIISTIAGNGGAGFSGDGGAATAAMLYNPTGVAVDGSGNVYVADYRNNRIRKISTTGIITTVAGGGTGVDGSPATAADLYKPSSLSLDGSGNIYIAETGNHRVRKVNTSGIISSIAGTGVSGYNGEGSGATSKTLSSPIGVFSDAAGNVYIADLGNNRIRKVTPAGVISTVAGNGVAGFSGDGGAATAATINMPYGTAIDASGNIYICDFYNNRIRKVNTSGVISTFAGTGVQGYYGDGGLATAANLYNPTGVAVDAAGNVYIADQNNQRVRKLSVCTMPVAGTVTGPSTVIVGNNISLTNSVSGGVWSSVYTAKATVTASGVVRGVTPGVDTIKYTVTNSCGTAKAVYVINVTASKPVGEITSLSPAVLNVYPNPSTGVLTIETEAGSAISNVMVFDISGKMLQQLSCNDSMLQVNISDYQAGIYLLKVQCTDGSVNHVRVIKQ